MGNFNRDSDGGRGGFSSRGRSDFGRGGGRGGFSSRGRSSFGGGDRQMSSAICSNCGKECQVPFRPTGNKPVYCSECFEKMNPRTERRSFDRPRFEDRGSQGGQSNAQLEAINAKLDKILNLLQPKEVATEVLKEEVKTETPKIKKTVKKLTSI